MLELFREQCRSSSIRGARRSFTLSQQNQGDRDLFTRTPSRQADSFMAPPMLRKGRLRPPDKLFALLKGRYLWGVQTGTNAAGTHATPANSP